MKSSYIVLLLIMTSGIYSQKNPYQVKFSSEIHSELADGSLRPSTAGTLLSFIGDYYNSATYSEVKLSWGVDTINVDHYTTTNALNAIIKEAQERQIVIISENHLKPQHRIFAKQLINRLHQYGFRHLGLEAVSPIDSLLNERGYPLNSPFSGVYTMEPQMNKLIISARQTGFRLFGYEAISRNATKDRDEIQADNIIKQIRKHPNSKFIILCGFHHAIESDMIKRGDSYWMAKYLKEKTGIDPLTIYQDNFTEKFIENQHPILRSLLINEPSVFTNKSGNLVRLTDHVDIEVIHPRTYNFNGRPHWLYETQSNSIEVDNPEDLKFPRIVAAYKDNLENSVPFDQMELKHKYDRKYLVLERGSYRIVITDGKNNHEYIRVVE